MQKRQLAVWILAVVVSYIISGDLGLGKFIVPLIVVASMALLLEKFRLKNIEYFLFFSIKFLNYILPF